jgi:hypothetical protein
VQQLRSDFWLPLLILNATSVSTGHRVVTTPLKLDYELPKTAAAAELPPCVPGYDPGTCRLFVDTYRFHDFLADKSPPDQDQNLFWQILARFQRAVFLTLRNREASTPGPVDVLLSTAAHNSARFPVVSPPGAIRNAASEIIDRVVDGGYFENYGATSALELFAALRRLGLQPMLLVISNDPEVPTDMKAVIPADRWNGFRRIPTVSGVVHSDSRDAEFTTGISGPIAAFANTRTARGTLTLDQLLVDLNRDEHDNAAIHIRTVPAFTGNGAKFQPLSMSWWMSKPVQARLHEQVECSFNRKGIGHILAAYGMPPLKPRDAPCLEEPPVGLAEAAAR